MATQEAVLYALKALSSKPLKALAFFRRTAAVAAGTKVAASAAAQPSPAAYGLMLRILGKKDCMSQFWSFLRSADAAGYRVDRDTFAAVMGELKKNSLSEESERLSRYYNRIKEADNVADNDTNDGDEATVIKSVVAAMSSEEDLSVEAVGEKLEGIELRLSGCLVCKVLDEMRHRPCHALSFFRWAAGHGGHKHGATAYNAMVNVLGREDTIHDFWYLIQEMKAGGHCLDIGTYVKLSRRFQKRQMVTEAVELYELMMDGPYKPSPQDCAMLLRHISLSPSPELELVDRVVRKHECAGYPRSKAVYDGMHRSLTSNGRFSEAEELVKKMSAEGHRPDNITYSQLVYGLCKAKRLEDARRVLRDMEDAGCAPDLKTWTILLQGACNAGKVGTALEFFAEMIGRNYDLDGDVLDVLVRALCAEGRNESAYTLLVEMAGTEQRISPWQATYKRVIAALLNDKALDKALELLRSMKSHKFPPFAEPFPRYIAKHGTAEDAAEFLKALSAKDHPSTNAYNNVFRAFLEEGRYADAQDLLFKCPVHVRRSAETRKLFESGKSKLPA